MRALTFEDAQMYRVNRSQEYEVTRQSLYDYQTYDGANGQTSLSFFQVQQGQSGKTIADTNMELAGQLPAPKYFLVECFEIPFWPGVDPVTSVLTPQAASNFANDVYTFAKSGSLDFFIGSKTYLEEAPLGRFPPKTKLETQFAVHYTQTAAADATLTGDYATMCGRPYFLDPYKILLAPTQNFFVRHSWPTAVPLPSGEDARFGTIADGILYKLSQ